MSWSLLYRIWCLYPILVFPHCHFLLPFLTVSQTCPMLLIPSSWVYLLLMVYCECCRNGYEAKNMYCFCVGSKFSSHNSHKICTTTCSDHFMGIQYNWLSWKPTLMCTPHTHLYRIQNKKSIIFYIFVYVHMCESMYTPNLHVYRCPQTQREKVTSPRVGVIGKSFWCVC